MRHALLLVLALFTVAETARADARLAGKWEIQSMGADRVVTIEQKGRKVIAHRVMWPEFEGERYKLEHLYRGTLTGDRINGELLVREEELPDYEVLRTFTARVQSPNEMIWDGIPMRRVSGKSSAKGPPPAADRPPAARAMAASQPPHRSTGEPARKL
jgi:hypothetical protein